MGSRCKQMHVMSCCAPPGGPQSTIERADAAIAEANARILADAAMDPTNGGAAAATGDNAAKAVTTTARAAARIALPGLDAAGQ